MTHWSDLRVCIHGKLEEKECLECGETREIVLLGDLREARNYALGNCVICSLPRGDSKYKRKCWRCGEKDTAMSRKRRKGKKWKPGMVGKPPNWWRLEQERLERANREKTE